MKTKAYAVGFLAGAVAGPVWPHGVTGTAAGVVAYMAGYTAGWHSTH